ncbi:phospholipase D family protein [Ideonella sp. A 288]|uniref:phospholipase D family protein n=1 Tax=Ideonella sp. A 288 TaxID=1962181 RepID=UPI000B4A87ED|nr:phospholipase D family protein [Ideonella sp. A 288]
MTPPRVGRLLRLAAAGLVALALAGCAGLPPAVPQAPSTTLTAPADAPLAQVANDAGVPPGLSGCQPLAQPAYALDARLQLIRQARTSIDLQTYVLSDDGVGRLVLRELRDAARRGVRVRLLLDDFHTEGMDDVLLGLAAHEHVEVRLFNPFASARASLPARLWQLATEFDRLNHRMHNKLLVADGAVAIGGGRNLADEYFFRSRTANFIDVDLLMVGAIVPELSALFDEYWNSSPVRPLAAVASNPLDAVARRASFDRLTADATEPEPLVGPDAFGRLPFGVALARRQHALIVAQGGAMADHPDKLLAHRIDVPDSLRHRAQGLMDAAQREIIVASPYYVPGRKGIEALRRLRERGVAVHVFTNGTAASDEPLVNTGLARYRVDLLRMGVRLFEVASSRLQRDAGLRKALAGAAGRLHAKLGILDRSTVLIGSMNIDPRSDHTNTEIGMGIRSPALAEELIGFFRLDDPQGTYELKLAQDGRSVQWVAQGDDGEERFDDAPGTSWALRLRLFLMSLFVSEDLL